MTDPCGLGPCAAEAGHDGTCAEASGFLTGPADVHTLRLMHTNGLTGVRHIPPLLDEIEMLRAEVDELAKAHEYDVRTIANLRAEKFHARRILAALIEPSRYVIEVDRQAAEASGQQGATKTTTTTKETP